MRGVLCSGFCLSPIGSGVHAGQRGRGKVMRLTLRTVFGGVKPWGVGMWRAGAEDWRLLSRAQEKAGLEADLSSRGLNVVLS